MALNEFLIDINQAKFPDVKQDLDANVTAPLATAKDEAQFLIDKILGIPKEARITVTTEYVDVFSGGAPGGGQYDDYGSGVDMIVPPGFSSDNYRFNARTGERVRITAPGQDDDGELYAGRPGGYHHHQR